MRSVLWASVQPAWLAPDEDYHWLYVNYLVVKHSVPDLHKGEYTAEFNASVGLTQQGDYLMGPRQVFAGAPHAILPQLHNLSRQPIQPVPRQVLEAPLYYLPAAVLDKMVWGDVSVTRLDVLRYYSAVLGALTIYFAWLLAAQILAREWQQLAAAAIASVQMILAFSASTITNDVGVAVTLTATMAWCAWMLRGPPRPRQGIGLGVLVALAVLMKATMLALVIIIPVMFALWLASYPRAWKKIAGAASWTVGVSLVLAGWWEVYVHSATNSFLGEAKFAAPTATHAHAAVSSAVAAVAPGPSFWHALSQMPPIMWLWIQQVYRSYWFSFLFYEVQPVNYWFWLPVLGMVIVVAGLLVHMIRRGRYTFSADGGVQRSILLLLFTAGLLAIVPMWLDSWSLIHGGAFLTQQGRFLTPAYPGLAVLTVIAVGELTRHGRRLYPFATAAVVIAAFLLYWHSWIRWVLEAFYGFILGWHLELLHASFDKPSFITPDSLAAIWAVALVAFGAAFVVAVVGAYRESAGPSAGEGTRPRLWPRVLALRP